MPAPLRSAWLPTPVLQLLLHKSYPGDYREILNWSEGDVIPPDKIPLHHHGEPFGFRDSRVRQFAEEQAARMRAAGQLYDGPPAMQLREIQRKGETISMVVAPCAYAAQAGSSFSLDLCDPLFDDFGGTLRTYLHANYHEPEQMRHLPGCFGVCAPLITGDRMLLVPRRGKMLASMAGSWEPSVAGGVDYDAGMKTLGEIFSIQLEREILEETGLPASACRIQPAAIALEGGRGFRPQCFALIETDQTAPQIMDQLNDLSTAAREHDEIGWIRLDDPLRWSADLLQSLNYEAAFALLVASRLSLRDND